MLFLAHCDATKRIKEHTDMAKKYSAHILLTIICSTLLSACQKIDFNENTMPGENSDEKTEEREENPSADTLTISDAFNLPSSSDTVATVKGYIVGYIKGNSLSSATFSTPDSQANTNMLLADSPTESDATKCLPVALEKGGDLEMRETLNLHDHPQLLHKCIAVCGLLTQYFRTRGIKRVYDFSLINFSPILQPENPEDSSQIHWPDIDHNPDLITGGR